MKNLMLLGLVAFTMSACGAIDTAPSSELDSRGRLVDVTALNDAQDTGDSHPGFARHGRSSMTRERVRPGR